MEPVGDVFINHSQLYTSNWLLTTHGLLAVIVSVVLSLRTCFWLQTCLPCITHILFIWTVSALMSQRKCSSEWTACRISHTPLIWPTVSFVLPNHKQFIRVNRMLYITHTTKIWPCLMHPLSQTACTFSDGDFTPSFVIIVSHTVSSKGLWS